MDILDLGTIRLVGNCGVGEIAAVWTVKLANGRTQKNETMISCTHRAFPALKDWLTGLTLSPGEPGFKATDDFKMSHNEPEGDNTETFKREDLSEVSEDGEEMVRVSYTAVTMWKGTNRERFRLDCSYDFTRAQAKDMAQKLLTLIEDCC